MKRVFVVVTAGVLLTIGAGARAADKAAKPDCSDKQKAVDDAKANEKAASKVDVSPCKAMKGQAKKDCETPIKEKAKVNEKATKDNMKMAKTALDCCKKPGKKGCMP